MKIDQILKWLIWIAWGSIVLIVPYEKNGAIYLLISVFSYFFILYVSFFINFNGGKIFQQVFVIQSIFWIVLRLIYLVRDIDKFSYNYILTINFDDLGFTIFIIGCGSLVFFLSLLTFCQNHGFQKLFFSGVSPPKNSFNILASYLLFISVEGVLVDFYFPDYNSYFIKLISIFFSIDFFILLFVIFFLYYRRGLNINQKKVSYFLFFLFVIVRLVAGSKSGLYVVGINLLIITLFMNKDFFIERKYFLFAILLLPSSIFVFALGTLVRFYKQYKSNGSVSDASNIFMNLEEVWLSLDGVNTFDKLIDTMSARISMLDYMLVFTNKIPINDYLGFGYAFKTFLNVIFPSFISEFIGTKDAIVLQANVFFVAYGQDSYQEILESYHSDMLPLFGYFYLNFGFFLSIAVLFIFFYFIFFLFNLSFKNHFLSFVYKSFVLITFCDILFGMGLVASFQQIFFYYLFPLLFFNLYSFGYRLATNLRL